MKCTNLIRIGKLISCAVSMMFFISCLQGQNLNIIKYKGGVNSIHSEHMDSILNYYNDTSDLFRFTYYGNQQVLIVRQAEDGAYSGSVLSYIYYEDQKDELDITEVFDIYRYEKNDSLDYVDAVNLSSILKKTNFEMFLQPEQISGYNSNWLHCSGSYFNVNTGDEVLKFSYPCLDNQDKIRDLDEVKSLDSIVKSVVPFDKMFDALLSELPKGRSYRRSHMSLYLMTDDQTNYRKLNMPRISYENRTKDSITTIFSEKINSSYLELDSLTREEYSDICYSEFKVNFDSSGKLISVRGVNIDSSVKDKDYRKCKQKITKFLKKIEIGHRFIYPQTKWIYIYEDEILVDDRRVF